MKGLYMKPYRMSSWVIAASIVSLALGAFLSPTAYAQMQEDEVKKLAERLTGVKQPGDSALVSQMRTLWNQGQRRQAAELAINHKDFLNVTVKQMALKMSNRSETMRDQLNDFTAMYIGVVKDNLDARLLLTGDFHYRANSATIPGAGSIRADVMNDIVLSNNHYIDLDRPSVDLSQVLVRVEKQPMAQGPNATRVLVDNPDPAGLLTTRAFASSHLIAGTNRRAVEFTMREFMCVAMADWSDIGANDSFVGRDVDRAPGGDQTKYQTSCKGCHAVMDSFRPAFAKLDFAPTAPDRLVNSVLDPTTFNNVFFPANQVINNVNVSGTARKYDRDPARPVYVGGYVPGNNNWVNRANGPANRQLFGWRGTASAQGAGVASFARAIADSRRFSKCMVQRVYEGVCRIPFSIQAMDSYSNRMADLLEQNNYSIKTLATEVALSPECGL